MSRYCLVFLETPLVAHDLALTVQDIAGLQPVIANTLSDAEQRLAEVPPEHEVPVAFVHLGPTAYQQSGLARLLSGRASTVVLVGHAAETEAMGAGVAGENDPGWAVLEQPFTAVQVEELLARVGAGTARAVKLEGDIL